MKNQLFILCCLVALFTNCSKSKNRVVDSELEVYVDRFFVEAAAREVDISDNDLEVVFRDLSDEGVCGLGHFRYEGTDLRKVEINPDFFCWGFHDDLARESLVFHELGHAVLKRTHASTNLPNGIPARIMCDGTVCDIFSLYDEYTQGKRTYYLDKLFRPSTPTPDWGKIKRKATPFFEETVETDNPMGQLEFSNLKTATNYSHTISLNPTSNTRSIQVTAKQGTPSTSTGSWVIRLDNPSITEGLGLKLKAKIATENMEGEGVVMIIRTLSGQTESLDISAAATSRNTNRITGNQALTPYEIDLAYYPSDVQQIALIFQILPNTTGTFLLDDIQLDIMTTE